MPENNPGFGPGTGPPGADPGPTGTRVLGSYCCTGESASTAPIRSNSGVAEPSENS